MSKFKVGERVKFKSWWGPNPGQIFEATVCKVSKHCCGPRYIQYYALNEFEGEQPAFNPGVEGIAWDEESLIKL